jgi:long-chain acyl-CoA synthetase
MTSEIHTTKDLVNHNATTYADTPFLSYYDEIVTYGDTDKRTNAFAAYLLDRGIRKGDFVAFMMANSPEFFFTLLGAQKIGAVATPISCWWQAPEVEFLVNDCNPRVLIVDAEFAPIVSEIKDKIPSVERVLVNSPSALELDVPHDYLPQVLQSDSAIPAAAEAPEPDDVAAVMYTSGTTGRPKGVVLTHRNVIETCRIKTAHVPVHHGERVLCVLPLFHSGGLNDLAFPCIFKGATIILRQRFSASEFWECVGRYGVNGFYIVPTMWNILLKAPEASQVDTRSLRFGVSGAAPIPPEQLTECEERFRIPILEGYGSTENTGGITANQLDRRKFGSVGTAFPGLEVRIFDDSARSLPSGETGEIVVRGDTVMKGYYNAPQITAETIRDGWLYTGDIGYFDEEGFLFIVDRKKDMIIRGGVNLYPKEIEHVIATHPAVDQVAVIPEPHETYGQVTKACIVLRRGKTASEEEILDFCREKMAAYKVPELIVFRESLPTSAVGKVVKKQLIQELEEEKTAEPVPVAHLFEGMPARLIPDQAKGVEATISYNITGKGGGKWTVTIQDGRMTLTEGILDNPRVYVVARDQHYHDVATGKLDGVTAVVTGKMKVEGDVGFMAELRQMLKPLGE